MNTMSTVSAEPGAPSERVFNEFNPNGKITREEFAKIAVMASVDRKSKNTNTFSDVANGSWYEAYIETAAEKGLVSGKGNGVFGVGEVVTRQDAAVILSRIMEEKGIVSNKLRKKGKKLDTYEVTSPPMAKEDIDTWCISKLPYMSRIKAGIKEALDNAKPDTLSLRTLWYLNTTFSNKWFDRARNIWELALFASDVGLLTGKEESEAFVSCVDHYLDQINAEFKDRLRAWRIIHEVCAYGVSRGVMKSNPATTKYSELYSLTDNTEYADIRETLVKKAFELVYESKLIDYLLAKVKSSVRNFCHTFKC